MSATNNLAANKQLIRKYLKAMTSGKPGALTKLAAPDIKAVQGGETAAGCEALEQYAAHYRQVFAGWQFKVERMVAEGNWVAVQMRSEGAVGGAPVSLPVAAHYRIARGKVAEVQVFVNEAEVARQSAGRMTAALQV